MMHSAGALGCVLHSWAEDADDQMHMAVCYLHTHPRCATILTAVEGDDVQVTTYCDSNWMEPRSTSGWTAAIEGKEEGSWTYCVVAHGSKGQGIPTANSAEAELVAEFAATRDTLGLREVSGLEDRPLVVRGDNKAAAVQAQMNEGKTTVVEIMCTKELGDPFRKDALKTPTRHLDKYKDFV